jgi:hypothetical protein
MAENRFEVLRFGSRRISDVDLMTTTRELKPCSFEDCQQKRGNQAAVPKPGEVLGRLAIGILDR